MPKPSNKVVDQVFDMLVDNAGGMMIDDVAHRLSVHPTYAGAALKQLQELGLVDRVRGTSNANSGVAPYVYFMVDASNKPIVPPSESSAPTPHRPVTKKRAKRGSMTDLVLAALPHWKPNGRGFTVYQMHDRVGQGSYETVRRTVDDLVSAGRIVKTDKYRKGSRVYLPAAVENANPVPAVGSPVNLAGVDALLDERDTIRQRMAKDEARLAEIEMALDAIRARLA